MPIILEGDLFAVKLNGFAGPRSLESEAFAMNSSDVIFSQSLKREQESYRGFDKRISLLLLFPDTSGHVKNDDEFNSDIIKRFTFRKRKFRPEISDFFSNISLSFYSQEDNRVTDRKN
jgi:hypothetical protein